MNNGLLPGLTKPIALMGPVHIGPTSAAVSPENVLSVEDDHNDYFGLFVANNSPAPIASTDIVMGNAAGAATSGVFDPLAYFDVGVNGLNNTNPFATFFIANDAYIFTGGGNIGNIDIATGTVGKNIRFAAGGLLTANLIANFGANNQQFNNVVDINNVVSVSSNAGTTSALYRLNTFTNSSASAMTITMPTSIPTPVDGQMMMVRIYDATGVTKGITWVNTENSTVSAPTTSNGSTTLPLTVGFQWNASTSKWRCIALA